MASSPALPLVPDIPVSTSLQTPLRGTPRCALRPLLCKEDIPLSLSFVGFLAIGALVGSVSGMFGIGGGILVIPAMVYLYGFDQKTATGTSLGMLLPPIGIMAFWQYYKADLVNVPAMLLLIVGFLIGSYLAAGFAIGLPQILVKRAFGGLMIVVGVIYILTAR
jgi:uncharacterized membrane protein YfcA